MAETKQQSFRMDVPTAVRASIWGLLGAIVFFLIVGVLDIRGADQVAFVFPIIVGWLYAMDIYKKITPSYLEAAGGGALAGAIYAVLVTVIGLLLAQVLSGTGGSLGDALADMGNTYAMDELASQVISSALLGAIGGAGMVLMRTQKID